MSIDNKPSDAPAHCPGTQSEVAGKSSACEGCPNQNICASSPKGPDPDIPLISLRMKDVKHKILILSGKGGVGKSTFTGQLAFTLSQDENLQLGVMDIDICGPSIPTILGVSTEEVHHSSTGWSPVYATDNLATMSVGFLLEDPNDAVIWRGPKKNGMIKQFLKDVEWGPLDLLLVDTPPGTSDEHLSIVQFLRECNPDGAIIITTPQEIALQDVRKEINFCKKVGLNIIGVVENMSGFVCPNCHQQSILFPPTTGGAQKMCIDMDVHFLGSIPLDPLIGKSCDFGISFVGEAPQSPAALAYQQIVGKIRRSILLLN